MNRNTIQEVLSVLKDIRAELRGNAEMRAVRRQLKQVIRELEAALESEQNDPVSAAKVLTLIAAIVGKIPIIVKAIEHLTNLTKHQ